VKIGTARTAVSMQCSTHACILHDDDDLICSEYNPYGQLGRGDTQYQGNGANEMGDYLQPVDLDSTMTETCPYVPDLLKFSHNLPILFSYHLSTFPLFYFSISLIHIWS